MWLPVLAPGHACFGSVGGGGSHTWSMVEAGSVSVAGVGVKVRSVAEDLLRERMGSGMVQSWVCYLKRRASILKS